jgi:hypothetical protein
MTSLLIHKLLAFSKKYFIKASIVDYFVGERVAMQLQLSRNNPVHVATVGDNGLIAVAQEVNIEMGVPRHNGKLVFIRRTYPAVYNHVVRNMNDLLDQTNEKKKWAMRGGHFLLYRYMVLLAFLLCFCFGIASIYVKACAVVSFIVAVLHIILAIYNIVIYRLNRPLIHPFLAIDVRPYEMPNPDKMNMFFKVPLRINVLTGVLAALVDPARIVAAIQRENSHIDEIGIMLYDYNYVRCARFPKECACYLILFIIMFILAIAFVSTTVSKTN